MLTVRRPRAGIVTDRVTGAPDCGRNFSSATTGLVFGLASSTNVSKKGPVAPSARNQLVDGALTPAELCPALKSTSGGVPKYIVRSAAPGMSEGDDDAEGAADERGIGTGVDRGARVRRQIVGALHRRRPLEQPVHRRDVGRWSWGSPAADKCRRIPASPRRNTTCWPCPPSPSRCAIRTAASPSHRMVRSTTSGVPDVDVTTVDTAPAPTPGTSSTRIVVRVVAGSVRVWIVAPPPSRRYAISTGAGVEPGLASATSRSKNVPVAPSAMK